MSMKKSLLLILGMVVALSAAVASSAAEESTEDQPIEILWWSHWANEPSKVATIEFIADEYMAEHPNVDIEIVWWDKNPLKEALRNAMTAGGAGAPHISTDMAADLNPQSAAAGWFVELDDEIPWENYIQGTKEFGTLIGPDGEPHQYVWSIGSSLNMILYNREIFAELGIEVPADYTFSAEEFVEVVRRGSEAGYPGFANAIGDRWYAATFFTFWPLFTIAGIDDYSEYVQGHRSWDTPDARRALQYTADLRDAGGFHDSFASMGIDEFHVYFHTKREPMMFLIPTWYTGRSFKPEDEGGQDPDWEFGMLRYPTFDGAEANGRMLGSFESGYVVTSASEGVERETAIDILRFATQPRYGAAWSTLTVSPAAIMFSSEDVPTELPETSYGWYIESLAEVYGSLPVDVPNENLRSGDFQAALERAVNQGMPLGLMTVDEAVAELDKYVTEQ